MEAYVCTGEVQVWMCCKGSSAAGCAGCDVTIPWGRISGRLLAVFARPRRQEREGECDELEVDMECEMFGNVSFLT
jgi:hypothetical protein